jgi:putative oxidoreductase
MRSLGLFVMRVGMGGLLAGHGAQKLFGSFNGQGLEGTSGWLESVGMRPGKPWALLAGASEFGGGVLTTLGLLHPIGPITTLAPMLMATRKVHWGKPVWATQGGAELPLLNMTAATGLLMTGPGNLSLDRALGIRVPAPLVLLTIAGVTAGVVYGWTRPQPRAAQPAAEEPSTEQKSGRAPRPAEEASSAHEVTDVTTVVQPDHLLPRVAVGAAR